MSNKQLAVINVVGLSSSLISQEDTPYLFNLVKNQKLAPLTPAFPAVTTTAQSAMLTGKNASEHGIVGNGWYFKDLAEVAFWKQSNHLVQQPKVWDALKAKDDKFTCANSFWWYNMYSTVDYSMTPRPHYPANGNKIFDLYSHPQQFHYQVEEKIGKFPFFSFWGPKAGIKSSQWIANAAVEVQKKYQPNLHLIYLPHLDYSLQKFGPDSSEVKYELKQIDTVLADLCQSLTKLDTEFIIVSEYGIEAVNQSVPINRHLRELGYIKVRKTENTENLDAGASDAFAVADHQVAHIYINDKSLTDKICQQVSELDGVEKVLKGADKALYGIDHDRAGDLIAIAEPNAWFSYYFWLDDKAAPDYARTIDIHRKPGYDPVEMFLDPDNPLVKAKLIGRVIQKKLGFRMLMDVIPLKPELIKGSHGRLASEKSLWPVIIGETNIIDNCEKLTDVYHAIFNYFTDDDCQQS